MEDLEFIEMKGDKIPVLCTLEVLDQVQTHFNSLTEFSDRLLPIERQEDGTTRLKGMPDVHAILFFLPLVIHEGIEVYNESHKIKIEQMTRSEICRKCDISIIDMATKLHKVFWDSINAPKS